MKARLDPEIKSTVLIKLSFGIPVEEIALQDGLKETKIANLRKNNYREYNEYVDHWKILPEIQALGMSPKIERAASITKKAYPKRFEVVARYSFTFDKTPMDIEELVYKTGEILARDEIYGFDKMVIEKNIY